MSNSYTPNTKIEASDNIKLFLKAWLESVEKLNQGEPPEMPDLPFLGLCGPLWKWAERRYGQKAAYGLIDEIQSLFHLCSLDTDFPFGEYEYRGDKLHLDENRVSWVKAALAGELADWDFVRPLYKWLTQVPEESRIPLLSNHKHTGDHHESTTGRY